MRLKIAPSILLIGSEFTKENINFARNLQKLVETMNDMLKITNNGTQYSIRSVLPWIRTLLQSPEVTPN
jgi:hypothetical protein